MAICLALKKAIKCIHHSCVMISTDNTTVVSYINKQGGTHSPILCEEVWKIHRWCLEHDILIGVHHIPGRFNKFFYWQTSFLDWTDLSKRMGFGSVDIYRELHFPNAQLSQCGFVCDAVQSHTPIVCISSSGQSCLSDSCIVSELELSSCTCISTNNSDTICSSQDASISVQNSSYCHSLAPRSMVFRGVTTISISFNCLPLFPKLLTQSKGKFQHPNLSLLDLHAWELSSNQLEIKYFRRTLQILSQNQDEYLLRKSMIQNVSYTPIGVIERRLIRSRPLLQ